MTLALTLPTTDTKVRAGVPIFFPGITLENPADTPVSIPGAGGQTPVVDGGAMTYTTVIKATNGIALCGGIGVTGAGTDKVTVVASLTLTNVALRTLLFTPTDPDKATSLDITVTASNGATASGSFSFTTFTTADLLPAIRYQRQQSPQLADSLKRYTDTEFGRVAQAVNSLNDGTEQVILDLGNQMANGFAAARDAVTAVATDSYSLAQRTSVLQAAFNKADTATNARIDSVEVAYADADSALAERITTVEADYKAADSTTNARIDEVVTAYTTADTALAQSITDLTATTTKANSTTNARIDGVVTAYTTADSALAKSVSDLSATVNQNNTDTKAAISAVQSAYAGADSAIAKTVSDLSAKVDQNDTDTKAAISAAITTEATARANADGATAKTVSDLSAALTTYATDLNARIATEETTRADADGALSGRIDSLTATVKTNDTNAAASIASETSARATADTALGSRIDTLTATVTTNNTNVNASLTSEAKTRADADTALGTRIDTLTATVKTNDTNVNASITSEAKTRADADTALGSRIDTLTATVTTNNTTVTGAISSEAKTRADQDGALSSRIDTVTANYQSADTALGSRIDSVSKAYADADSALSSRIDTAQATANNASAAVSSETTARVNADNTLLARYALKLDGNGYITGWETNNNGQTGNMIFTVDNLYMVKPGAGATPLVAWTNGEYSFNGAINATAIRTGKLNGDLQLNQRNSGPWISINGNNTGVNNHCYIALYNGNSVIAYLGQDPFNANDDTFRFRFSDNGGNTIMDVDGMGVEVVKWKSLGPNSASAPQFTSASGPWNGGSNNYQTVAQLNFTLDHDASCLFLANIQQSYGNGAKDTEIILNIDNQNVISRLMGAVNDTPIATTARALSAGSHVMTLYWKCRDGSVTAANASLACWAQYK